MSFPYQKRLRQKFRRLDDVVYGMGYIAHVITTGSDEGVGSYAAHNPKVEPAEAARREAEIKAFADQLMQEARG